MKLLVLDVTSFCKGKLGSRREYQRDYGRRRALFRVKNTIRIGVITTMALWRRVSPTQAISDHCAGDEAARLSMPLALPAWCSAPQARRLVSPQRMPVSGISLISFSFGGARGGGGSDLDHNSAIKMPIEQSRGNLLGKYEESWSGSRMETNLHRTVRQDPTCRQLEAKTFIFSSR